jgi:dihydrofolate synthase/folylpolyglutamate synthase
MISFKDFLNSKPLYYKEIDHNRIKIAYKRLKPHLNRPQKIVHIVGTNGKGSTGRIMATLLKESGYSVGHYSSPHILKFNERIWIDGENISDKLLEEYHKELFKILGEEISKSLSYFEYTTLLAFIATQNLDILILEAGLGGEFDATNVIDKDLSIITPIDFDHQDFLGNSIKEIATTKLNSIRNMAIIGFQPHKEVESLAKNLNFEIYLLKEIVDLKEAKEILAKIEKLNWGYFLYENSLLAINAIKLLGLEYNINSLEKVKLFGRFYPIRDNIIIDVGHNVLSAKACVEALKKRYNGKKRVILVYNSLKDKDFKSIIEIFKDYIKRVEIIPIESPRAVDIEDLKRELKRASIDFKIFNGIDKNSDYLIFGSFLVVENFIKKYLL